MGWQLQAEEEEGLHGAVKRLRRNGHQLVKGSSRQVTTEQSWQALDQWPTLAARSCAI
jgi:hypothetical protein